MRQQIKTAPYLNDIFKIKNIVRANKLRGKSLRLVRNGGSPYCTVVFQSAVAFDHHKRSGVVKMKW